MKNKKIDVIIPAYNVEDKILFKCLSSIACQNISEDLKVTIVDDGSTIQNYKKIAKFFKPFLDIQVLRYEENKGPGVARQYAIDRTNNEYIVFIDADDTFAGAYSLHFLKQNIEKDNDCVLCISEFDEMIIEDNNIYSRRHHTIVGIAGKIYRRSFLDAYNIRFHPTSRANEDSGFNYLINLYIKEPKQIQYIQGVTYFYYANPNSVTRKDSQDYTYKTGFQGYIENYTHLLKIAKLKQNKIPKKENIYYLASRTIYFLYIYFSRCIRIYPNEKKNF